MKELKQNILSGLDKGFSQISQMLNVYKSFLENLNSKSKEDEVEDFIHEQMDTLKAFCLSHLSMIQNDMIKNVVDWKKKNSED